MSGRARFALIALVGLVSGFVMIVHQAPSAGVFPPESDAEQDQLTPNLAAATAACGVERWSVKTGTDPDAGLVNLAATTTTTIATMRSYSKPASLPANNRILPQETTVFSIDATLIEYKLETDSDYHLVIRDGSGNTMITEISDPACAAGSLFLSYLQSARSEFGAMFVATSTFKFTSVPVRVRGLGFFDFLHGQTGVAPNGIELHPVLDIQFNPPPPTPTVSSVTPTSGPPAGGTSIIVTGTNFNAVSAVTFGASAAAGFAVNSPMQITATSPRGSGTVDVTVTTPSGTSARGSADLFTYVVPPPIVTSVVPAQGPEAGGTPVTINGANFIAVSAVTFGASAAAGFSVSNSNQILATSPPGSGIVDVSVSTATGVSAVNSADIFVYGRAVVQSTPNPPGDRATNPSSGVIATPPRIPLAQAGPLAGQGSPPLADVGPTRPALSVGELLSPRTWLTLILRWLLGET